MSNAVLRDEQGIVDCRFYLRHDLKILRLLFFSKIRDLSIPLKAHKLSYNINNLKERCFPGRKWTPLGLSNHQRAKWGFQRLFLSGCCRNITSEALSKFIFSSSFFAGRITRSITSGDHGSPCKTSKCKVFPAEFGSSIKGARSRCFR